MSCTGTTGFTWAGSRPCSAMASRRPARSTRAVCPRMSWHTTRAGNQGKSRSRLLCTYLAEALAGEWPDRICNQVLGRGRGRCRRACPGRRAAMALTASRASKVAKLCVPGRACDIAVDHHLRSSPCPLSGTKVRSSGPT